MKKIILVFTILQFSILLSSCSPALYYPSEIDESQLNPIEGVVFSLDKAIYPEHVENITGYLINTTNVDFGYDPNYLVQVKREGGWYSIQFGEDTSRLLDYGMILKAGKTDTKIYDLKVLRTSLKKGQYRIIDWINVKPIAVEFSVQ